MVDLKETSTNLEFSEVNSGNINQLKILNSVLFPIKYHQKFYNTLLKNSDYLAYLVYCDKTLCGTVCYSIEKSNDKKELHILTLGVLAAYRRQKIGSKIFDFVFSKAKDLNVDSISLNVHVENESALNFYKKFDFSLISTIPNYYVHLKPSDAYLLRKNMNS